jgi:hypothetical protein
MMAFAGDMIDVSVLASILTVFVQLVMLAILVAGLISLKNGINVIHRQTDGMKDELVREVRVASLAKGVLQEKQRDKSEE